MDLPDFFLADDASSARKALYNLTLVKNVTRPFGVKINLDLALGSLKLIDKIACRTGRPVFVDMKMWNGPRTMSEVIRKLAGHGATMVNIWAEAGHLMEKPVNTAKQLGMTVLGLTVLTHYDDSWSRRTHGIPLPDLALKLARMALIHGCDGVILPGTCLKAVLGLDCVKFVPAVRPEWYGDRSANAQKQIMTPGEAILNGATIVSCHSPIYNSDINPKIALSLILDEIEGGRAAKAKS